MGDELLLRDGGVKPVEALAYGMLDTAVYNFDIEGLHCYAVGRSEVLVHNGNAAPEGPRGDEGGAEAPRPTPSADQLQQASQMANELRDSETSLDHGRWLQQQAVNAGDFAKADQIGAINAQNEAEVANFRDALRQFLEQIGL